MSIIKLSEAEATRLIQMLKRTLVEQITFPNKGKNIEFKVNGDTKQDVFIINIYRGSINDKKYNINARILINNIMLLELHINPTNIHSNPDGTQITGNHWHIYTEKYYRKFAIPAKDIQDTDFVDNTILFLKRFHVIKQPIINYQPDLF